VVAGYLVSRGLALLDDIAGEVHIPLAARPRPLAC
jgi:hypothetical protein